MPDSVEKLDWKPGDTIILRYDALMSHDELERISAVGKEAFPGANVIVTNSLTVELEVAA